MFIVKYKFNKMSKTTTTTTIVFKNKRGGYTSVLSINPYDACDPQTAQLRRFKDEEADSFIDGTRSFLCSNPMFGKKKLCLFDDSKNFDDETNRIINGEFNPDSDFIKARENCKCCFDAFHTSLLKNGESLMPPASCFIQVEDETRFATVTVPEFHKVKNPDKRYFNTVFTSFTKNGDSISSNSDATQFKNSGDMICFDTVISDTTKLPLPLSKPSSPLFENDRTVYVLHLSYE